MKKMILVCGLMTIVFANARALQGKPPAPPTIEQRLQKVSEAADKELKLDEAQKKELLQAYKDFFTAMEVNRDKSAPGNANQPPPPVKKEIADKLSAERDARIKKIISAAEYQKYETLEKTLRPKPPAGQQPAPQK